MKRRYLRSITTFLGVLLSCAIVVSFGLHTIELSHVHPGDHDHHQGDSVTELLSDYMHGTEKKSFLFVLAALLFLALYVVTMHAVRVLPEYVRLFCFVFQKLLYRAVRHSYLCYLFQKGILNTKRYYHKA